MSGNFQKQLDSISKTTPQKYNTPQGLSAQPITVFDSVQNSSIFSKVFYLLIGIFVVMLLLIAINFLVYPIFPSWLTSNIGVPGSDDSKLFWNTPPPLNQIILSKQPFRDIYYNYTVMVDIQIDNPTMRLGQSRVFLIRGPDVLTNTVSEDAYKANPYEIFSIAPTFNFIVYCEPISTNVNIAISTRKDNILSFEREPINNFPIQKSVRLTIVLMEKTMEIYINGLLYNIHSFAGTLVSVIDSINPPLSAVSSTVSPFGRVQNLRLWRRTLLAQEIKKWGSGSPFPDTTISDTCVT